MMPNLAFTLSASLAAAPPLTPPTPGAVAEWSWITFAWLAAGIIMLVLSFFISGLEIGTYSLNRVRLNLRASAQPPDSRARILARELENPGRLLSTLLICNNVTHSVSSTATTVVLGVMAASAGYSDSTIALISAAFLSPVLFIVGEAVPKELFRIDADRLTYIFARPLAATRIVLTVIGVVPLIQLLSTLTEKLSGLSPENENPSNTADGAVVAARLRIANLLKEGAGHGVLSDRQVSLVDRALVFRSVTVGDEMIPWANVRTVPTSADRDRLARIMSEFPYRAFPAVDRSGRVVGLVEHLDLYLNRKAEGAALIKTALRVKASTPANDALVALRGSRSPLAIVEDDSGKAVGIVTDKDLVEPLIGDLAGL